MRDGAIEERVEPAFVARQGVEERRRGGREDEAEEHSNQPEEEENHHQPQRGRPVTVPQKSDHRFEDDRKQGRDRQGQEHYLELMQYEAHDTYREEGQQHRVDARVLHGTEGISVAFAQSGFSKKT